jgi:hypothetical protein
MEVHLPNTTPTRSIPAGLIRMRLSGRCESVPGRCGKNLLFFTPLETHADRAHA